MGQLGGMWNKFLDRSSQTMDLRWRFSKGNYILRGGVEGRMRGFAIVRMMVRRGAGQIPCLFLMQGVLDLHWLSTTINSISRGKDVREIQRFGGQGRQMPQLRRLHPSQEPRLRGLDMRILRAFLRRS